jgi:hypothetical protein
LKPRLGCNHPMEERLVRWKTFRIVKIIQTNL